MSTLLILYLGSGLLLVLVSLPLLWGEIPPNPLYGFRQVTPAQKDRLLRTYGSIPKRQVETSVVLANAIWRGGP